MTHSPAAAAIPSSRRVIILTSFQQGSSYNIITLSQRRSRKVESDKFIFVENPQRKEDMRLKRLEILDPKSLEKTSRPSPGDTIEIQLSRVLRSDPF